MMRNKERPGHPTFVTVTRYNHEAGTSTSYQYVDDELAEEHIFVPDPRANDETCGWIIGTSLNTVKEQTTLNIFAANGIANGPVARLLANQTFPLGLHRDFVAA